MKTHKWGELFEIAGIEPTPFIRKMMQCVKNDGSYSEAEYAAYIATMDAICSRKPEHVNLNCLNMLRSKASRVAPGKLRASAIAALDALEAESAIL